MFSICPEQEFSEFDQMESAQGKQEKFNSFNVTGCTSWHSVLTDGGKLNLNLPKFVRLFYLFSHRVFWHFNLTNNF